MGNLSVMGIVSQQAIIPQEIPDEEKDAQRLLFEEAINYIDRWNQAEDELASLLHLAVARPIPTIVTIGGIIDVGYLLDIPHDFEWKGVYVDADLRIIEVSSTIEQPATSNPQPATRNTTSFMQLSALQGSILENRILEDDFGVESISTAKLFCIAKNTGVSILTIDQDNIETILPTLVIADNIKEDITNAVNQGMVVKIPEHEIVYEDWTGTGYIKENPETGESGWMLSGMIAGSMTVWALEKWPEYVGNLLKYPFSKQPNYDPESGVYIYKVTYTDMQKGTVGTELDKQLMVMVEDEDKHPVYNVKVIFTVKAGGGTLKAEDDTSPGEGQTTITVTTDYIGSASAGLILGKHTSANPTMWWENGFTYHQQAGENIVDVRLESGLKITSPFTAFGLPTENKSEWEIKKTHVSEFYKAILDFAGFVSVLVQDQHENPISNVDVTFTSGTPTENPPICVGTNKDTRAALLFKTTDSCVGTAPTYDENNCSTANTTQKEITSHKGAAVQVIVGGLPNATYPIAVSSEGVTPPDEPFYLYTYPFGNCSDEYRLPSKKLMISGTYPADMDGNNINAKKVGDTIALKAKLYSLNEGEAEKTYTASCYDSESDSYYDSTCEMIVGSNEFEANNIDNGKVHFGDQEDGSGSNGLYECNYTVKPGVNNINIHGEAELTSRRTMFCPGCHVDERTDTYYSGVMTLTIYGVDIVTKSEYIVPVDENGYVTYDYLMTYTITPSEYHASTAYVVIIKDSNPIRYIPSDTTGTGFGALSQGFKFDLNSSYKAQVILNPGTKVEIKSEEIPISFVEVELKLKEGNSVDIDPTASRDDRKRDLQVITAPPIQNLEIVSIEKKRSEDPNYGHNHSVDCSDWNCSGSINLDSGFTNADGIFDFYYRGNEMAGVYEVTVKFKFLGGTDTYELKQQFDSKYTGLGEFTGGTGITLTGETESHPSNHWATSTTRSRILDIGSTFHQQYNENLQVNDMSLQYGGLFDINGNCLPPHSEHRKGMNADIYPALPSTAKWNFIKLRIIQLGSSYVDEINTSSPHIHFRE